MPWSKCSQCGEPVYVNERGVWACIDCGGFGYIKKHNPDTLDPRLIHDAMLPEVVGDYEAAEA